MARPTRSRWVGRCRLMPQSLPPPRPFAVAPAPPLRRRTARAVPSTAPAVRPRRRSTRWSSTTSRPSSPRRRTPTPWAGASPDGWSATSAATCGAASSPTGSRGCAAQIAGTTGSWPSPARVTMCWPLMVWSRATSSAVFGSTRPPDSTCETRKPWRARCSTASCAGSSGAGS